MLSLAVTNTNRSREGLSLTENYLFTVESIGDYIAHLTEQGSLIVIAHDDVEILRLLTTCLTVFEKCGLESEDAMKHFYILGSDTYPVFVLKKVPLTKEESEILYNLAIEEFGFNPMSTYFPLLGKGKLLNSFLVSMETGQLSVDEAVKNVESHGYDISPVTDNNPFFYKFEKGIPKTLSLVLRLSLLILMLVILIPLVIYRKKKYKDTLQKIHSNLYFDSTIFRNGIYACRDLSSTKVHSFFWRTCYVYCGPFVFHFIRSRAGKLLQQ
ncbi:MAG: hypothetical protein ACOX15_03005 [Tepidanaerobacteraceae bacterium]